MKKTYKQFTEEMAANSMGGGGFGVGQAAQDGSPNLAGFDVPFGKIKRRKQRRESFAGCPVFTLSNDDYAKCMHGRMRYERWNKKLNMEDIENQEIRTYAHRNPGKPIIVKDERYGTMSYFVPPKQEVNESVELDEGKFDYDPRIKKMSKKGKEILAHMTNSYETATHDDWIDHKNVHTLPKSVVQKTLTMASKERNLPAKQKKELALVKKELGESVELDEHETKLDFSGEGIRPSGGKYATKLPKSAEKRSERQKQIIRNAMANNRARKTRTLTNPMTSEEAKFPPDTPKSKATQKAIASLGDRISKARDLEGNLTAWEADKLFGKSKEQKNEYIRKRDAKKNESVELDEYSATSDAGHKQAQWAMQVSSSRKAGKKAGKKAGIFNKPRKEYLKRAKEKLGKGKDDSYRLKRRNINPKKLGTGHAIVPDTIQGKPNPKQVKEGLNFKSFIHDVQKKMKMTEFDRKERARLRELKREIHWYNTKILGINENSDKKPLHPIHKDKAYIKAGKNKKKTKEAIDQWNLRNPKDLWVGESVELDEDNTSAVAKQVKQAVKKHVTGKLVVRSKGGKTRFIMVRADKIDNKLRKKVLDVVAPNANVRDKNNISYGNITSNIISAGVDQWVKALGLNESVELDEWGVPADLDAYSERNQKRWKKEADARSRKKMNAAMKAIKAKKKKKK